MMSYEDIFNLNGKSIILTGATGYLGKFFANALLEFGADLAILDLKDEELSELCSNLKSKFSNQINSYVCDITNENSVEITIKKILNDFKKIDVLINNAQGNDILKPIEEITLSDWRKTTSVNEEGLFLVSKLVGNIMSKQSHGGSIIQISSIYGILGPDHRIYNNSLLNNRKMGSTAAYSFSKAGIIGLTKYLSTYWAENNIRVNAITPGGIESNQNKEFKINYSNRVPLNRMGKPDEIIGALIFLASNASSYITGQNIIIDGGLSAW